MMIMIIQDLRGNKNLILTIFSLPKTSSINRKLIILLEIATTNVLPFKFKTFNTLKLKRNNSLIISL